MPLWDRQRTLASKTIGDVRATINYDAGEFDLVSHQAGAAVVPASVFVQSPAGQPVVVLVQNASANNRWNAGEYQLARLTFRAKNAGAKPIFRIPIGSISVVKDGTPDAAFRGLDAIVFST